MRTRFILGLSGMLSDPVAIRMHAAAREKRSMIPVKPSTRFLGAKARARNDNEKTTMIAARATLLLNQEPVKNSKKKA